MLHGMVPFREALGALDADAYLWLMRYAKGGEHLKVRVHIAAEKAADAEQALRSIVEPLLDTLAPLGDDEVRRSRPEAIPIDEDDRTDEDYPDRSLRITRYGVSHVCLGGSPFLELPAYRAHMTRCLGVGCDLVLEALADRGEPLPDGLRRRVLLETVVLGLRGLGFAGEVAADYLGYHRDWLVRFPLLKSGAGTEAAQDILARYGRQSAKMGPMVGALGAMVGAPVEDDERDEAWPASLASLLGFLEAYRDDPDYRLDPFATDPVFAPIFKVFHGLANHVGLNMIQEGFAHHLLLQGVAADPDRFGRIALTPLD